MYRWSGLVVVIVAMVLAACGRQITGINAPNGGNTELTGHMLIRFRVAGPLDFTNVNYVIVFNTSGNGNQPLPDLPQTGYANYSFAFVIGGSLSVSQPQLIQYYFSPGTGSGLHNRLLTIPPSLINYVANSGGNPSGGGEFTIDFNRALLNVPTPTASATPNVQPTTAAQHIWAISFITTDRGGYPLDSMAISLQNAFPYTVDTTQFVDSGAIPKASGLATPSNPGAQLQGFEVINSP